TNHGFGVRVFSFGQRSTLNAPIRVLFGAVACLLLIACTNVANLLLVRANARRREMSVRAALGGTRWQLLRQLLGESVLLALLGGGAGVLLAQWILDFIRTSFTTTPTFIRLAYLRLDSGVLWFAVGLSVV